MAIAVTRSSEFFSSARISPTCFTSRFSFRPPVQPLAHDVSPARFFPGQVMLEFGQGRKYVNTRFPAALPVSNFSVTDAKAVPQVANSPTMRGRAGTFLSEHVARERGQFIKT